MDAAEEKNYFGQIAMNARWLKKSVNPLGPGLYMRQTLKSTELAYFTDGVTI